MPCARCVKNMQRRAELSQFKQGLLAAEQPQPDNLSNWTPQLPLPVGGSLPDG
jgi:hypothetical protein